MKRIMIIAVIAIIAMAAGWNFNQSKNEVEFSDLALANVEALASGEGSSEDCNNYCTTDNLHNCKLTYHLTGETHICPRMTPKSR